MVSCRAITEWLSRSLDQPLPWWRRWLLAVHLIGCPPCARFGRQLRFLAAALATYLPPSREPEAPLDLALSAQARERIRRALRESS